MVFFGENTPDILTSLLNQLAWLGIAIDPDRHRRNEQRLYAEGSGAVVWVIRAAEEHKRARRPESPLRRLSNRSLNAGLASRLERRKAWTAGRKGPGASSGSLDGPGVAPP